MQSVVETGFGDMSKKSVVEKCCGSVVVLLWFYVFVVVFGCVCFSCLFGCASVFAL